MKVLLFHGERYLYSSVVMLPYFKRHISVDGRLGEDDGRWTVDGGEDTIDDGRWQRYNRRGMAARIQ